MRLNILNSGYTFGTKVLFAFIHLVSRQPLPDAARLVFYRPDFYGAPMGAFTHLVMRGPSAWSVGDRELMAAFVSKMNACAFCIGAHTATAAMAYQDEAKYCKKGNYCFVWKALPNSLAISVYFCGVNPVKRLNSLMK